MKTYQDILHEHLSLRRLKNSRYSLRAFARDLGLQPSHLSSIFAGKRGLSQVSALAIADELKLKARERNQFVDLVMKVHARSSSDRERATKRLSKAPVRTISKERYRIFDRWYYPAVLQWLSIHDGVLTTELCARDLSMTPDDVRESVTALLQTGFLSQSGSRFVQDNAHHEGSSAVPSPVMRNYHAQTLRLAAERIESTPQHLRKNLSTYMTFDSTRAQEAREFLENVQREFLARFEAESSGDSVFVLSLNTFRLDRGLQ